MFNCFILILTEINLECNQSISLKYQWMIKIYSNNELSIFQREYSPIESWNFRSSDRTIRSSFHRIISKFIFVRITSAILVQLGTLMIRSEYEQHLKLNPIVEFRISIC